MTALVFRHFYGSTDSGISTEPLTDLFRESAQSTYFVLRRAPHTRNYYQQQIAFYRFDETGLEISCKTIDLKEFEKGLLNRERSQLFSLAEKTLFGPDQLLGDNCLIIRKVCSDFPDEILYEEKHCRFRGVSDRIQSQFVENH
jgi:hypothetical protein